MSNATVSRLGQDKGTGDATANFKDIYSGEVITAFQNASVTQGRHMTRNIDHGKSASFPIVGIASGGYHTPGTEILGRAIKATEKTVLIDGLLMSDAFVAEIDELMNHYDVRSIYSSEQGNFLASVYDRNILSLAIKAARAASNLPGSMPGGSILYDADFRTDAAALAAGLFAARTEMDEKKIPTTDFWGYLRPAQYALLVEAKETISTLYGGMGSYADGTIFGIAGVPLVKTTDLPVIDLSGDVAIAAAGIDPALLLTQYRGDFSKTAAVVAHKAAVGTVQLLGLNTTMDWDPRRKGTLIVSGYVLGSDYLRPECSVELSAQEAP